MRKRPRLFLVVCPKKAEKPAVGALENTMSIKKKGPVFKPFFALTTDCLFVVIFDQSLGAEIAHALVIQRLIHIVHFV